jgi:hypothetical protein
MTLSALRRAWRFHRRLVLTFIVGGAVLAALFSQTAGSSYEARATVLLSANNYDEQFGPIGSLQAFEFDQAMSTKLALARGPAVRAAAQRRLGRPPAPTLVEREPTTQLIHFTSTGASERDSVASANAVASAFVAQEVQRARAAAQRTVAQLNGSIDGTRGRLEALSLTSASGTAERAALTQRLVDELSRLDTANRGLDEAALAATVSSPADVAVPAGPLSTPALIVLGLMLGGVLGIAVAAVREQASDVAREPADIAAAFPSVPAVGALKRSRRALLGSRKGRFGEEPSPPVDLNAARTARAIVDRHRGDDTTVVLVATPVGDADATRVTQSVARALAETGQATLAVVRGDLAPGSAIAVPEQDAGRPRWGPPVNGSLSERGRPTASARRARTQGGGQALREPVPAGVVAAAEVVPATYGNLTVVDAEPVPEVADPIAFVERSLHTLRPRGRWVVFEGPALLWSPVHEPMLAAADAVVLAVSAERTTWETLNAAVAAVEDSPATLVGILQT